MSLKIVIFSGMNAIVFGASSGIGRELAIRLSQDGYKVKITGRREELLKELCLEFPQLSYRAFDIQDLSSVENNFADMVRDFGTIDLIVHCAGVGYENPELIWEMESDTIATNVCYATKIYDLSFLLFKRQGFGHLVGISSIASLRGNRHSPAYFASKAFQVNYLESLYLKTKEIASSKVHVTDIRPGFVDTRMALGDDIFWMSPLNKAVGQIYRAIKCKRRRVYISKRWTLIAWVLKIVPSWLIKKIM